MTHSNGYIGNDITRGGDDIQKPCCVIAPLLEALGITLLKHDNDVSEFLDIDSNGALLSLIRSLI